MSARPNDEWLEAAKETFGEALEDGNIKFAKDIIQDTIDAGFGDAARDMNLQLRQATKEEKDI